MSRQAKAAARPNKHGASEAVRLATSELPTTWGVGVPHIGVQACHIGVVTCFGTRRAPSSPHLACGLNGSLFLRFCTLVKTTQAGGRIPISEFLNTCGTLRRCVLFNEVNANEQTGRSGSRLGKRVSFFLRAMRCGERPVFVGLDR